MSVGVGRVTAAASHQHSDAAAAALAGVGDRVLCLGPAVRMGGVSQPCYMLAGALQQPLGAPACEVREMQCSWKKSRVRVLSCSGSVN